jgi:hypothetical protein
MKLVNLDAATDAADHARAAAKQDAKPASDLASLIFDVAKHNLESYRIAYDQGYAQGHKDALAAALKILDRAKVTEVAP